MVTLEYAQLKGSYRILWLRYVYGADLSQHCMKSLLGHNDRRVRGYMRSLPTLNLEESRFYYLCGVDEHFVWERNLHLAFAPSIGGVIEIDNPFIKCRIVNARRLEISQSDIDWTLKESRSKIYNTCRNWWFANKIAKMSGVYVQPREASLF